MSSLPYHLLDSYAGWVHLLAPDFPESPDFSDVEELCQEVRLDSLAADRLTRLEQLTALVAWSSLQHGEDFTVRRRFARRVSQIRELRRLIFTRLVAQETIPPQAFLEIACALAGRPFLVPSLLHPNRAQLVARIDLAQFERVGPELLNARSDTDVLSRANRYLNDHSRPLPTRVADAVRVGLERVEEIVPVTADVLDWCQSAANLIEKGAELRTVRAMYVAPSRQGETIDFVVGMAPHVVHEPWTIPLGPGLPDSLREVATRAYRTVARALGADPEARLPQIWLSDFPGGTADSDISFGADNSAGLPLAVAFVSALTGRAILDNIVLTGDVGEDGTVGSVVSSIPIKVQGIFWRDPTIETRGSSLMPTRGYVPKVDFGAAQDAAGANAERLIPIQDIENDVLGPEEHGPLEPPRFGAYLNDPFPSRGRRLVPDALVYSADEMVRTISERVAAMHVAGSRATVLLPWWIAPKNPSLTGEPTESHPLDLGEPLEFVAAGWLGDGLLADLAERAQTAALEPIPMFLDPETPRDRDRLAASLAEFVHQILRDKVETDIGTVAMLMRVGRFRFIVNADCLNNDEFARLVNQASGLAANCQWVFLAHATRAGQQTYTRHPEIRESIAQGTELIDLVPTGRNCSVWDAYLKRAVQTLIREHVDLGLNDVANRRIDPAWLEAFFGTGTFNGEWMPHYLARRLEVAHESLPQDRFQRPQKPLPVLDNSPYRNGVFNNQRAFELEVIQAPSGRGKTLEVLAILVSWLAGRLPRQLDVPPLYLHAATRVNNRYLLVEALSSDERDWVGGLRDALEQTLFEGERGHAELEALRRGLGVENDSRMLWRMLLADLGPTAIIVDALREVPDELVHPERLVQHIIELPDGSWLGQASRDGTRADNQARPRVVLIFRSDIGDNEFARRFWDAVKQYEEQHRTSELLPVEQEHLIEHYLEPAFAAKPDVLVELRSTWSEDSGLLTSLTSDLRILRALTRLDIEHVVGPQQGNGVVPSRSLRKMAIERRWVPTSEKDGSKGEFVEEPVWRLYGGQIIRWALETDCEQNLDREERDRESDGLERSLPPGNPSQDEALQLMGLLAFLATATGRRIGQLALGEVAPILKAMLPIQDQRNPRRYLYFCRDLVSVTSEERAVDLAARHLERVLGRLVVRGRPASPAWSLEFRHEEDRTLATVWLIDRILEEEGKPQEHRDAQLLAQLALPLGDAGEMIAGRDLVRYAFALMDEWNWSEERVTTHRASWADVYRLFEEASNHPAVLFNFPEVRQRLGME